MAQKGGAAGLGLQPGRPRTLTYAPVVRSDLRLLEVDEALLAEISAQG